MNGGGATHYLGAASDKADRALVVEIVGISGCGKSTLVEGVVKELASMGYKSLQTRDAEQAELSYSQKVHGLIGGIWDTFRLSRFFIAWGTDGFTGPRRLLAGLRHGIRLRSLDGTTASHIFLFVEPGWPMQLIGQCMQTGDTLSKVTAKLFLQNSTRADLLIVLDAQPQVSIDRMAGRKRGFPKSMRSWNEKRLNDALACGRKSCGSLATAARELGIETLELDVSMLSASDAADAVVRFLLQRFANAPPTGASVEIVNSES